MSATGQTAFAFAKARREENVAWLESDAWSYRRGMPAREGAAIYVHLIRAPKSYEPEETMSRGKSERTPGGENDRVKKGGTPEEWAARIVTLLEDGRPRTFNTMCVQLVGTTADVLFSAPIDAGLWLACERSDIVWTVRAPIFWTLPRFVEWPA